MNPAKAGNIRRAVAKGLVLCGLMAAWVFLFPQNSVAQSCPAFSWPVISAGWSGYPENKYTPGGLSGGIGAAGDACACWSVSVSGDQCAIYIDGQLLNTGFTTCGGNIPFGFSIPDIIPEGAHTAEVRLTARGCSMERSYNSPPKDFYVDKTSPVVSLTKPQVSLINYLDNVLMHPILGYISLGLIFYLFFNLILFFQVT